MPTIHQCRFTAIDFESAGAAKGKTDTPVQIGLCSWSASDGHHAPFVSYLHTDQPIQWVAQKVHGISNTDLANAPSLLSLWPELKTHLSGAVVVAHGKGTEKRFLRAFPGHGFGPWVDTLLLSRALWPTLEDHALSSLCNTFNLSPQVRNLIPNRSWHDALFDAAASLVLLTHIIETLQLGNYDLDSLLSPNTSGWHRTRHT